MIVEEADGFCHGLGNVAGYGGVAEISAHCPAVLHFGKLDDFGPVAQDRLCQATLKKQTER